MKVLENQTLYQCEFCGKRLLSKKGASLHERQFCKVVRDARKLEKQRVCKHEKIDTHYDYILGEAVMEPKYDYCVDCGKKM